MDTFIKAWIVFQVLPTGWTAIPNSEYDKVMEILKSRYGEVPGPGGRITNGYIAKECQFPYEVALVMSSETKGDNLCGGAIISKLWVLTAAHCLLQIEYGFVIGGTNDFTDPKPRYIEKVLQADLLPHEHFSRVTAANDIGLIRLTNPIPLSESPISFPDKISNFIGYLGNKCTAPMSAIRLPFYEKNLIIDYVGETGTVAGWGVISDAEPKKVSSVLLYIDLTINKTQTCIDHYHINFTNILCANTKEGKSVCMGDSGSPLEMKGYAVGLVSFGAGLCANNIPVGFTRNGAHLDWIAKMTNITSN